MFRTSFYFMFFILTVGGAFSASAQSTGEQKAIDRYVEVAKRAFTRGAKDRIVIRRVIKVLNGELEALSKNTGEINEIYSRKKEVTDLIQERITIAEAFLQELESSDLDMFKEKPANAELIKETAAQCCQMLANPSLATRILSNNNRQFREADAARGEQRQTASDSNFAPDGVPPARRGKGGAKKGARAGGGRKGTGQKGGGRGGARKRGGASIDDPQREISITGSTALCLM